MLEGKRIAILVEEGFEDVELVEPMKAMEDAGARVTIVGSGSQESYKGKRGTATIKADMNADEVKIADFDAIIVPGGYAPDRMRLHQAMIDLAKNADEMGKIIAAICHGQQLLISADIVRGRRLTSYPSIAIDLKNAGANWVDEPVVKDGNLITSRKPVDLPKFNKAIIETLLRKSKEQEMKQQSAISHYMSLGSGGDSHFLIARPSGYSQRAIMSKKGDTDVKN